MSADSAVRDASDLTPARQRWVHHEHARRKALLARYFVRLVWLGFGGIAIALLVGWTGVDGYDWVYPGTAGLALLCAAAFTTVWDSCPVCKRRTRPRYQKWTQPTDCYTCGVNLVPPAGGPTLEPFESISRRAAAWSIVLALLIIAFYVYDPVYGSRGAALQTTAGVVVSSGIRERWEARDRAGTLEFGADIRYTYDVGGETHRGWFEPASSRQRSNAEAWVQRYPAGSTITVWYPASNPSASRLEPRSRVTAAILYLYATLLLLLSLNDLRTLRAARED